MFCLRSRCWASIRSRSSFTTNSVQHFFPSISFLEKPLSFANSVIGKGDNVVLLHDNRRGAGILKNNAVFLLARLKIQDLLVQLGHETPDIFPVNRPVVFNNRSRFLQSPFRNPPECPVQLAEEIIGFCTA